MANRMQTLDAVLKKCYDHDLDWSLLPIKLREVCGLFGKGMKQRETTVFLGILALVSFCMGHACIQVHEFWPEPIILWMAIVLPAGRCKSTFNQFLHDILDKVNQEVQAQGNQTKPMIMPHCTWDKFGDILANSGARRVGLFDELVSFFSIMNMYSATKLQVSNTQEYQDFLQMYAGKAETRETVTGNANFKMNQTSFTLVGFTEPQAALPIIEDLQKNAEGFTSQLLWWFPTPVFCKLRDTMLQETETEKVKTFSQQLVDFLAQLYIKGETTYSIIEDKGKMTSVEVKRKKFTLNQEAIDCFEKIDKEWELNVCEKYPHDALVGGLYSQGKSHILRLAVPIQLILDFCNETMDTSKTSQGDSRRNPSESDYQDAMSNELVPHEDDGGSSMTESAPNDEEDTIVTAQAVDVACSIVSSCLAQICALNGKSFITSGTECNQNDEMEPDTPLNPTVTDFKRLLGNVLQQRGRVVSLTLLNQKGVFCKPTQGISGTALMLKVANDLPTLLLGNVETFTIPGNNSQVHFLMKSPVPENHEEIITFIQRLASVGVNLENYRKAYDANDAESDKHLQEYNSRKITTYSPTKRPRQE